jgi:WXG100 family type VII secretion target
MAAPKIRADHDGLQSVSAKFAQQADATRRLLGRTKSDKATLEGGDWMGVGAAAFYREMNDTVLPTLERLARALESASQVTKQISSVMKEVEAEAAGLLDGSKAGGAGGGAADGNGNGAGGAAGGAIGDAIGGGGGAGDGSAIGDAIGGGAGGDGSAIGDAIGGAGGDDGSAIGDAIGGAGGDGEAGIGDFMQDQINNGGAGGLGSEFDGGADSPMGQAVQSLDGATGDELLDQFNQAGRDLLASVQGEGQDGVDPNALGGGGGGSGGGGGGGAGEALAALGAEDPSAFDGLLDQSLGGGGGGGSPNFGGGSGGGGSSGGGAEGGQAVPRALSNSNLSGNQKLLALAIQILKKDPNAFNGELKKFVETALANGEMGPATAALRGSLRTLQGAVQTAGGNVSDDIMAQVSQLEQSFGSILSSDVSGGGAPPAAVPSAPAEPVFTTMPVPSPSPTSDAIMGLVNQFTQTVENIVPSMAGL